MQERARAVSQGSLSGLDKTVAGRSAARTIYLNKTCFNGLYRVNRKGQFNTPFGKYKNPKICDAQALREASKALQNAAIVCGDYAAVLAEYAEPGDFVFLDPPYIPVSEYSDFKRYTKEQFEISDHSRLAVNSPVCIRWMPSSADQLESSAGP